MQPIFLLAVLVLPAVATAAVLALGLRVGRHREPLGPDTPVDEATRQVRDHLRRARTVGAATAGVVAVAWTLVFRNLDLSSVDSRLIFVAAPAIPIVVLVAVIVGEATVPLTRSPVRVAALAPRTLSQYVGRARRVVLWAVTGAAAVALVTGIVSAAPDGRSFRYECTMADGTTMLGVNSPYPGAVYAVPGLLVLAGAGLATVVASRRVLARPPVDLTADPEGRVDHGLRRNALRSATRAATASAALLMAQTGVGLHGAVNSAVTTIDLNGPCDASRLLGLAAPLAGVVALAGAAVLAGLLVDVVLNRDRYRERLPEASHA